MITLKAKYSILATAALLLSAPVMAQDDATDDADAPQKVAVKRATVKKYDTRTIKGKVLDATGVPVSGAIVKAQGIEGYSALTDDNGAYTLNVPKFTSAIYVTAPDHNGAVVGLRKGEEQPTASISSNNFSADYTYNTNILADHSTEHYQYSNAANIKDEMSEKLGAYAHIVSRGGTPGIGSAMFIQGLNSLNANAQPLFVVDGVIYDQQNDAETIHDGFFNDVLSTINTADIEDVTVMRNGTALYGARGANGVVLITTKRSKSMATRITASVSAGATFEPKYYSMMGAEQYRSYASELLKGTGTKVTDFKFLNTNPSYYYYNQYHNNTDWKDMIYRTAITQNYGISVEGGDDVAQYKLSVGYVSNNSTLEDNNMNRLNIRFNTDIKLTSKFDIRFDASYSNTTRDIRDDQAPLQYESGTPTSPSFLAYVKAPFMSPYSYGNGQLSTLSFDITDEAYLDEALSNLSGYNYKLGNPAAINEYGEAENKNRFETSLLNISVTPKFRFNKHLELSEHFSYSLLNTNENYYIPINGVPDFYVNGVKTQRENEVASMSSRQNSIQSDTRLTWNNRYDAHDISAFVGARIDVETYTRSLQGAYNTGSDKTPFMNASLANKYLSGADNTWHNWDWYLQGDYNYLGRYFLKVNVTASASSKFGNTSDCAGLRMGGANWGIFPSVQAAWVMSNEPWFKVPGVDYLRITAGFDVSGNDDVDVNASRSYFANGTLLNTISGITLSNIGNTKLQWETTKRFNAGFEMNLLKNRMNLAFNFFTAKTDNLLSLQALNYISGLESNWGNSGSMRNTGVDFKLSGKIIAKKDWSWELGASIGHYNNKLLSLYNGTSNIQTYNGATFVSAVNSPAFLFYGYETAGVYSTSAEAAKDGYYILGENGVDKTYFTAGDVKFVDQDGNKIIDENDRVVIGDPNPDVYGNIFTSLQWKRLRLDANFSYSIGNDVFNYMRQQLESGSRFMNQTTTLTRRWQVEGDETDVPRIDFQDTMGNSRFSDRWIEDGSYLKLKSLTLSYTLPVNSTVLQGLQFWIQGNNLFTLTKYLGSDPEFSTSNSVIGQGIDLGRLGNSRSIVAGVKVNL